MCVLDAVAATVPALVCDDLHDVVAQNALNVAMLGPLAGPGGLQSNLLWRWFTDPAVRGRYAADQHDALSREYVADLRSSAARRGVTPRRARSSPSWPPPASSSAASGRSTRWRSAAPPARS
jgi:hypothetical protein